MTEWTHKKATANGINLHCVTVGKGPLVLCMHGWPQNHREFLRVIEGFTDRYTFIAQDLQGFADSEKPYDGYEPKTIAADMLGLLEIEKVNQFHILSHDLGGGPSHWRTWRASAPCRSQPSKRRSLGSTFLDTSSPPADGHGVAAPGKSSLGVR
jgi:pimeloyl-ACP methyl ester carboxylesterase